uniref:Uncharacterized protein n=1 Tax=Arundo donax TaxID=35708 RepID=A0A0A9E120_ARUDO
MTSPSMFTFTHPTTRPFFSLSSLSFCASDSSGTFLVPASEALSLGWLNRLFILKVLMGGHPTTPKLCGCPEATVPGDVVAVGVTSALALLLAAVAAAPAAGEDDDTEESGDRAPGCRSLAVRIRHGAGDEGCCFLDPR